MRKCLGFLNWDIFHALVIKIYVWFVRFKQKFYFHSPNPSSWYIPTFTIRPDRIGFANNRWSSAKVAEENTNSPARDNNLPALGLWLVLIFCPGCKVMVLKPSSSLLCFWEVNVSACYNVRDRLPEGCDQRRREAVGGGHRPWALLVEFPIS